MTSEEAQFVARAERLAGPTGVVGFQRAAAREAAFAPQNRYVLPQFEEKTPYGYKRQVPVHPPVRGSHHLHGRAGGRHLRR